MNFAALTDNQKEIFVIGQKIHDLLKQYLLTGIEENYLKDKLDLEVALAFINGSIGQLSRLLKSKTAYYNLNTEEKCEQFKNSYYLMLINGLKG
ncbi:MAG: hypothetical protein ACI4WG_01835 [Erysipelotrichaceae bacterium]